MNAADTHDACPDALSPTAARALLERLGVRPNRALGQNFLIDRNIARLIVTAAEIAPADDVLEVGPGLGALTLALADVAGRVIAVEKDRRLAAHLRAGLAARSHVDVREADMLDVSVDDLAWTDGSPFACRALVSNLPYSAGSRILVNLARSARPPARMVVTVQREVAARIAARSGEAAYGLLSLWLRTHYEARVIHAIGPRCFYPEPEVESSVVRLDLRADRPAVDRRYYSLTKQAFGQRRKQLARTLASGSAVTPDDVRAELRALGAPEGARPEHLDVAAWVTLAGAVAARERKAAP